MNVKWYGTAALSVSAADETILFDPFISLNDANRYLTLDEIADIEHIFITHGHFDHLMHVPELLKTGQGKVYCDEIAADTLQKREIDTERIICIKPGDTIKLNEFEINVLKGDHIVFDRRLIIQTVFNRRVLKWKKNLGKVVNGFKKYPKGQVLIYNIKAEGRQILHLGSLGMCIDEKYPSKVDLMTIPFQGRSDLDDFALHFVRRINPQVILLHHFDDSFPPVSNEIDTTGFIEKMSDLFPAIKVIKPEYLNSYKI